MKRRREWSALLAGVMALGVLGGGISVSADEDVPTIVIYNNSGAFSVAGAEAGAAGVEAGDGEDAGTFGSAFAFFSLGALGLRSRFLGSFFAFSSVWATAS